MTITLTDEQAERVKAAVAKGEYASHSEVIRDALREWELGQALRKQAMAELTGQSGERFRDGRGAAFEALG